MRCIHRHMHFTNSMPQKELCSCETWRNGSSHLFYNAGSIKLSSVQWPTNCWCTEIQGHKYKVEIKVLAKVRTYISIQHSPVYTFPHNSKVTITNNLPHLILESDCWRYSRGIFIWFLGTAILRGFRLHRHLWHVCWYSQIC